MAYRLDGGEWQQISPSEGEFDSIEEAFAFDLPPLAEGIYQLDLLVHTSPGGDRIVSAASVVVVPAPGSTALQELHDFTPNPTTDNTPTYSGIAAVMDGIVATVEFRIDGGNWQPAEASDGHFDAGVETFVFTTFALAPGLHIIEVRTTDSAGKIADPCCGDTLEILETHTVYLPSVVHNQ